MQSQSELQSVGAFRYECYRSEGLIDARTEEVFLDRYDCSDGSQIFMVAFEGKIVGSIRLHLLDMHHRRSATMESFPDILLPKIESGLKLVDGARFAVASDLGALRLPIARKTLRLYSEFARLHDADLGVAAVQPERVEFYKRLYGFSQISEPRAYGGLEKELVLIEVDLAKRRSGSQGGR